jgi:phosphopantetheinyl transferase
MPITRIKEIRPGIRTGLWRIDEEVPELISGLNLSAEEASGYHLLKNELRKRQWLAYRRMVCEMLDTRQAPVHNDAEGKPLIVGYPHKISVSHTENYASVIISETHEVGIDIERLRTRILRIREKFLSSKEMDMLQEGDLGKPTILWCAKEALYKLYGKRNLDFRKQISLDNFDIRHPGSFGGKIIVGDIERHYRLNWEKLEDLILVYVIEDDHAS